MSNLNNDKYKQQISSLASEGKFAQASQLAKRMVQENPNSVEAGYILAQLFDRAKQYDDAIAAYYKVCSVETPVLVECLQRIVLICSENKLDIKGYKAGEVLAQLRPDDAKIRFNVSRLYSNLGLFAHALPHLECALTSSPTDMRTLFALAKTYFGLGEIAKALDVHKKALAIEPSSLNVLSHRAFIINNLDAAVEEDVASAHFECASAYERNYPELKAIKATKKRGKVRLGYVSDNFNTHSVPKFLFPLFEGYDRSRFEVYCYDHSALSDSTTKELKACVDVWRDIKALPVHEVAKRIQSDRIDILVDLMGYAGRGLPSLFALKPAAVQVSYLGYPNTSGLTTMDYRITDDWSDPEGTTEAYFSEKLVRLPSGFLCYRPAQTAPDLMPLPAMKRDGVIRFASFNAFAKITPSVFTLWTKILKAVPASELYIKGFPLNDGLVKASVVDRFVSQGIDPSRLMFSGFKATREAHLDEYSHVDIHLDTAPYNGTTTTCEALWQGVPSVVIEGKAHRSRVGVSILSQVGLEEFIARSEEDYVTIAINLAKDLEKLNALRLGMRARMASSLLMNQQSFVDEIQAAFLEMLPVQSLYE